MTPRRTRLQLEELGSRVVPSTTPVTPRPVVDATAAHVATPANATLTGLAAGSATAAVTADGGTAFSLRGSAVTYAAGPLNVLGSLQFPGFGKTGTVSGSITLTGTHGSVTLQLSAPNQSLPGKLPIQFNYTVTDASGSFASLAHQGALRLSVTTNPVGTQGWFGMAF